MPYSAKYQFEVQYLQILNELGVCDETLLWPTAVEDAKKFYEWMYTVRLFDEQAIKLQRMGKMGTYASSLGQEASPVGAAYALADNDVLVPSFREQGAFLVRDVPLRRLLLYWGGSEQGSVFKEGKKMIPIAVPVGSQSLHAAGIAWAQKLRKEKNITLVFFGDGATSEGDVQEAMNFAGVFHLPLVFVCQNNQFAISVPRVTQSGSNSLAQKAIAYGFEGVQVDGNDALAVYVAAKKAVEKARNGQGPTFIECVTYRRGDHTTADDATRYRDPKEVEEWKKRDPLDRLKLFLQNKKAWSEAYEQEVSNRAKAVVENAVNEYLSTPAEDPHVIFGHLYAQKTAEILREEEEFTQYLKERGQ